MEEHDFDSPKQVSAATNVTNMKILSLLTTAQLNVSEIAARLGVPVPTANYHVKQLEDANLVIKIGEDEDIGRDRQRFMAISNRFWLRNSQNNMSEAEQMRSIASFRHSFEEALKKWELSTTGDWPRGNRQPKRYGLANVKVSPERYGEMFRRVAELLSEFIDEEDYNGDDAIEGMLVCLFFPTKELRCCSKSGMFGKVYAM